MSEKNNGPVAIHNVTDESVNDPIQQILEYERSLTLWQAMCKYKKAVFWAVVISNTVIMEGYDTSLISSLFAFPAFKENLGNLNTNGTYEIPAPWQSGVANAASCGQFFGLIIAAWCVDRFGYRKTLIANLLFFTGAIFIVFFANSLGMLTAGQVVCGLPWGAFQSLAITYVSDVTPVVLKPYMATYVNLCWVIGHLISAGVLRGLLNINHDPRSYRIAFGLQWIWPLPLCIGIFFAPESPVWLLKRGKEKEAMNSAQRLTSTQEDAESFYRAAYYTNLLEVTYAENSSYSDLFKGANRRRTLLVLYAWVVQAWCGSAINGYSTYFMTSAGMSTVHSFDITMVKNVISFIGTFFVWFTMRWLRRRFNILIGLFLHCVVLLVIGILGTQSPLQNSSVSWAIAGMILCLQLVYSSTMGPIAYLACSEFPTARLRAKTASLGRNIYLLCSISRGVITPYMLNATAWNWGAKTGFFWMGFSFVFMIVSFVIYPEAKNRSPMEMDYLFEHKVPSRKFYTTEIDDKVGEDLNTSKEMCSIKSKC